MHYKQHRQQQHHVNTAGGVSTNSRMTEDEEVSLATFMTYHSLPGVVQVTAGRYGNVSADQDNELYVHTACTHKSVVAEFRTVSMRRSRIQTVSLPLGYSGWFELMSVDGRIATSMTTVRQLVDVFPARCLVRRSVDAQTSPAAVSSLTARRVAPGELLTLVRVTSQRVLHCRDEHGDDIYLPLSRRGLFSPVNEQLSGSVFSLHALVSQFRLPINVRLVSDISQSSSDSFSRGVLRLIGVHADRVGFVLPLRHAWSSRHIDRHSLVAIPSSVASRLTVQPAAKDFYQHWLSSDDGVELDRRCSNAVDTWRSSIQLVPGSMAADALSKLDRDNARWSRGPISSSVDSGLASSVATCVANDDNNNLDLMREIDDIYAMIRAGPPISSTAVSRQVRARSADRLTGRTTKLITRQSSVNPPKNTGSKPATKRWWQTGRKPKLQIVDISIDDVDSPAVDRGRRRSGVSADRLSSKSRQSVDAGSRLATDNDKRKESASPPSVIDPEYEQLPSPLPDDGPSTCRIRSKSMPELVNKIDEEPSPERAPPSSWRRTITKAFRRLRVVRSSSQSQPNIDALSTRPEIGEQLDTRLVVVEGQTVEVELS